MKVAYDHQIFTVQAYGGVSRYIVELAKRMSEFSKGEVDSRIFAPLHINDYLSKLQKGRNVVGLQMPNIPGSTRLFGCINRTLSPLFLENFSPHIIHETYYSNKKLEFYGAKRVVTVHDMIHEIFPHMFPASDNTRVLKKNAIAQADHVICVSENTRVDLHNFIDISPSKTSVVHHGFSSMNQSNLTKTNGVEPFILYVGSRGNYKNFDRLIYAFASSKRIVKEFKLVAFGGGNFSPDELAFFKKLKIPEGVVVHVSGDDWLMANFYKDAELFVYPSLYEGFGFPPLEALSSGCPVACSNVSSIPEIVGDAAIFFDPYSIDSIRVAMESILYDSSIKNNLLKKGNARLSNFSWEKCVRDTHDVYQSVLQDK